ncbi:MAG TPA: type II secretion system F family protein, partial [Isosphaeraceae bacterium]|nr:type II secretion system F family protein [Isosphaeraceae bacterium]
MTLDEFIALNDEIAALVRVGIPLERGLLAVGKELSGKSGRLAQALAERLNRGETLQQALKAEGAAFPGIYRAVVEAGLRAGRLSVALEGLARFARSYAELRRAVALALFYPLFVGMLAYALFVVFVLQLAPRFA